MKVLFDAFWTENGPPSGRMVVNELLRSWRSTFPEDELLALIPANDNDAEIPAGVSTHRTLLRPQAVAVTVARKLAAKNGADAIITQNFAVRGRNSCVFLHDVIFQSHPEYFTSVERAYFRWLTATLKRADIVFTSSRTEAERIREYNPHLKQVQAVGLGLGTNLISATTSMPAEASGLRGFVLTVGRLNVRKNLDSVFSAALLSRFLSADFPLLVVGERDGKQLELSPEVSRLVDAKQIRFLRGVSDANLRWLYEKASVLVFPSLDEGFGLPPMEAMHFGCPVVLSDIPVFRELYSGRAHFVDPLDAAAIADAIESQIKAGRSRPPSTSSVYSWERVVTSMRDAILERQVKNVQPLF